MATSIRPTRGNRAGFNGLVSSSALVPGQIYAILDEKWLALATGPAAFIEVGRGDIDVPDPAIVSAIRAGTGDGYLTPPETWAAQEPVELNPANPDLGSGINFKLTLAANTTLADPIGARLGQEGPISIFRAGSETLSFGPAWQGFGNIDLPAEAGKEAEMQFRVVSLSPVVVRFSVVQEA